MPERLEPQPSEAVFLVVEGHALDQPGKVLGRGRGRLRRSRGHAGKRHMDGLGRKGHKLACSQDSLQTAHWRTRASYIARHLRPGKSSGDRHKPTLNVGCYEE